MEPKYPSMEYVLSNARLVTKQLMQCFMLLMSLTPPFVVYALVASLFTCSSKVPLPAVKDKGDLKALYPDRFDGIGKFEGEYHIVNDPDVPSVVHAPRKCPMHIKDDIKKELDEMINLGVIIPVSEPTDWVSSVAYSQKSNGRWRLCLDPKDLNQAVKRTIIIRLP